MCKRYFRAEESVPKRSRNKIIEGVGSTLACGFFIYFSSLTSSSVSISDLSELADFKYSPLNPRYVYCTRLHDFIDVLIINQTQHFVIMPFISNINSTIPITAQPPVAAVLQLSKNSAPASCRQRRQLLPGTSCYYEQWYHPEQLVHLASWH